MTKFDYDKSLAEVEGMEPGVEKAAQYAVYGLYADTKHHKQWFLEQILVALGEGLNATKAWLESEGYGEWEAGIAP